MTMDPTAANRPLRVFEKVLEGGLQPGNVGVVLAKHGTGKQALLTLIAVDKAMGGDNVLLVSADKPVHEVRAYRDEVLREVEKSIEIKDRASLLTKVERHTRIHVYRDGKLSLDRLRETLRFAKEHADFEPHLIEFSGWPDLAASKGAELPALKQLAKDVGAEIWLTVHTDHLPGADSGELPAFLKPHEKDLGAVITMQPEGRAVPLRFLRTHGKIPTTRIQLVFDPATMLLRWN